MYNDKMHSTRMNTSAHSADDIVVHLHTHLKSLPSNFLAPENSTVLAGMFRPKANVSVANKAYDETKACSHNFTLACTICSGKRYLN